MKRTATLMVLVATASLCSCIPARVVKNVAVVDNPIVVDYRPIDSQDVVNNHLEYSKLYRVNIIDSEILSDWSSATLLNKLIHRAWAEKQAQVMMMDTQEVLKKSPYSDHWGFAVMLICKGDRALDIVSNPSEYVEFFLVTQDSTGAEHRWEPTVTTNGDFGYMESGPTTGIPYSHISVIFDTNTITSATAHVKLYVVVPRYNDRSYFHWDFTSGEHNSISPANSSSGI